VPKSLTFAVLALLLASCGAPRPRQNAPQSPAAQGANPRPLAGSVVYRIDPGHSELRLLVYRAGPMALLGHNHVIVNRSVTGRIDFAGTATASSFSLSVAAAGFVVDEAQARSEEGPDFSGEISADAKAGTLHNMLSAGLLDAAHYPVITVRSAGITGAKGALTATLVISVAGHESKIAVPFTFEAASRRLSAVGTLDLRQSTLGLTPFSVMLGALQVQDDMRVKFSIVALAT
jgi:polyisoprenoid-binding protein YceI